MAKIQKPYPNFHSARVKSPGLFVRVRVLQTTKQGIMIYGGPLKTDRGGSAAVQSIRFPKDKFTPKQAKKWLKDHKLPASAYTFEPAKQVKKRLWSTLLGRPVNAA